MNEIKFILIMTKQDYILVIILIKNNTAVVEHEATTSKIRIFGFMK